MDKVTKILALLVALACLLTGTSSAQVRVRVSPALALARICVSEAGWDCFTSGDGLAIHEVLLRGAAREGMGYVAFATAYAGRVMGARPHDSVRLRWVGSLREDGREPDYWPDSVVVGRSDGLVHYGPGPSWSRYRAAWLAVLARAREVVGLTLVDTSWSPCVSEVHDWGGSMDRLRAARIGLIPVECGETANDFYARPSLVQDVEVDVVDNVEVDPD